MLKTVSYMLHNQLIYFHIELLNSIKWLQFEIDVSLNFLFDLKV